MIAFAGMMTGVITLFISLGYEPLLETDRQLRSDVKEKADKDDVKQVSNRLDNVENRVNNLHEFIRQTLPPPKPPFTRRGDILFEYPQKQP